MVRTKKPRSLRPRRGRKSTQPSRTLTKQVLKIIHRDVENKQAFTNQTYVSYNSGINSIGDMVAILPNISQGTGDNARIGDQLRGQSITIKGALSIASPNILLDNCRIAVRMFIVQPKLYGDYATVQGATGWLPLLLKKGASTSAFTGVMSDLWAPVNTDAITKYYDKTFYLTASYKDTAGTSVLGNSVKFFSKKLNLRNKLMKYDNGVNSGLTPTHYAPVIILGYVHMNNVSPDIVTTGVQMSFDSIFNYEDA